MAQDHMRGAHKSRQPQRVFVPGQADARPEALSHLFRLQNMVFSCVFPLKRESNCFLPTILNPFSSTQRSERLPRDPFFATTAASATAASTCSGASGTLLFTFSAFDGSDRSSTWLLDLGT